MKQSSVALVYRDSHSTSILLKIFKHCWSVENYKNHKKVQVGNDQANAQSKRNSHSKTEVGKNC